METKRGRVRIKVHIMHKKWNPDPDYLYIFRILRFASNSPGTNVQSEELENPLRKTVKSLLFSSTNRGCFHNENKNKIKNNATPGSFLSQSLSGIGQNKISLQLIYRVIINMRGTEI